MSSRGVTPLVSHPAGLQIERPAGRRPTRIDGDLAGLSPSPSSPEPRIRTNGHDWTRPTGQDLVRDIRPVPLHVPPIFTDRLLDDLEAGYDADDERDVVANAGRPVDRPIIDEQPDNVRDNGGNAPDLEVIDPPPSGSDAVDAPPPENGSEDAGSAGSGVDADPMSENAPEPTPLPLPGPPQPPPPIASYGNRGTLASVRPDLRTRPRDVVKETGASTGYLIQGGQKLLQPVVTGMQMTKVDQPLWKAWEKPDSDAITNKGDFLKNASKAVTAMGDFAQPLKLVEYGAALKKNFDEYGDYQKAKNVVAKWETYDRITQDLTQAADSRREAKNARDALDSEKVLAEKLIASYDTKGKVLQAVPGQVKGYSGFVKYGLGTYLAGKHCVDGLHHLKHGFCEGFKASAKATARGAFGVAAGIIGVIFYPASAAYYYWQGGKDTSKLEKIAAMQGRVANLAGRVGNDALFSDVVERVRRKTDKDTFATKFKRWTNRFRSGIAAISTVGSAAALTKAAGVTIAVIAGAGAVASSWPLIVGIAGVTALATGIYGIYKLARHHDSQSHRADQRDAFQAVREFADADRGTGAADAFYGKNSAKKVVEAMAADRSCFDAAQASNLVDRFAARSLTGTDLANISTWAERENVRSSTSATLGMLLSRLVADGPDRSNGNGVVNAADLLHELGVDDAKIESLYHAASAVSQLGTDEAQAKALKAPMDLLAKELQLR